MDNFEFIDMEAIKQIESGGNPNATSPVGAMGLYQIMPITLKDYNQITKKNYKKEQLFDPDINTEIAEWYLTQRIPQMLKHYKKPVTTDNILWAYNAGIGNLVKNVFPKETKNYLYKYKTAITNRATDAQGIQ